MIGTQLELSQISRFARQYLNVTLLQALLTLGGSFGLVLPEKYFADAIRLDIHQWGGRISINQINAYAVPETLK